jgi:uncharacterized protein (DUF1778 family)
MPALSTARGDLIEPQVSQVEKRILAAAAACERLDLTGFVLRAAL